MSRILCAWELGGAYGHLAGFLPLALKLKKAGHEVFLVLRDLSQAEGMFGRHGVRLLQAPLWLPQAHGLPPAVNYAELLFRFGYLDKVCLTGVVKAWRELYGLVRPDLLVADHAPTALLAAAGTGIRRALFGTGFAAPPRSRPMPSIQPWKNVPSERLRATEERALEIINALLGDLGAPPLEALSDLFDVEENFLCTLPELDHYPERGPARYWGPRFNQSEGVEPAWPGGEGGRVFAYLHGEYLDLERLLEHLARLPIPTLAHLPDAHPDLISKYAGRNLAFSPQPVRMADATAQSDLVVCHGGHGTTAASLLAGRPVLMLPLHVEQGLLGYNVTRRGLGMMASGANGKPDYGGLINRMLATPAFADRARRFAAKYADFDQSRQMDEIARRCDEILAA